MSLFYPLKKTTLHIPNTGPAHDKQRGHLFVVVTSPDEEKKVLTVSISSAYDKCDKSCLIPASTTHKFIKRDSFVLYAKATLYDVGSLCKNHASGVCEYMGLIDDTTFENISNGLMNSGFTPPWAKRFYEKNFAN